MLYPTLGGLSHARRGPRGCADGLWPIQDSLLCDLPPWWLRLALMGKFWQQRSVDLFDFSKKLLTSHCQSFVMHTQSDRNNSTPAPGIIKCPIHPLLQKVFDLHLGHRKFPTDGRRLLFDAWKLSESACLLTLSSSLQWGNTFSLLAWLSWNSGGSINCCK